MMKQQAMPETAPSHKRTLAWGEQAAENLWANTLSRAPLTWRDAVTLDFGCSWGYLAKLVQEEQGAAESYGVDIHPMWEDMSDGSRPAENPHLHLYAGNILDIPEVQDVEFDIIYTSGTLFLLEPSHLKDVVQWFYDRLKPGGHALLRTRSFLSHVGADIHHNLASKAVHLLYPRRTYDAYFAARGLPTSRPINPSCAATYLMLYQRCGFETLNVRRHSNPIPPELIERHADRFGLYDQEELATSDVTALLQKPATPRSMVRFAGGGGAATTKRTESGDTPVPRPQAAAPGVNDTSKTPGSTAVDERKATHHWGAEQAAKLRRGLLDPVVSSYTGMHMLDVGCSWGYLLKHLAQTERPARLLGTDVVPLWTHHNDLWQERPYAGLISFHEGDLPSIAALQERSFDLITCASVLQYMTPEQVEANLTRMYDLLRPGGRAIIRTRVFTSYMGMDLHHVSPLKFAHLFYGEQAIAQHVAAQHGKPLRYLNWLTASTYAAIFIRTGFEVPVFKRRMNRQDEAITREVRERFPWIALEELLCAEVEAVLYRPIDGPDLAAFHQGAAHPSSVGSV